jgi:hypothetical protein
VIRVRTSIIIGLAAAVIAVVTWLYRPARAPGPGPGRAAAASAAPPQQRFSGYVSSDACRECHRDQHASWHKSFHRTMTRYPAPDTVKAPFTGVGPLPIKGGHLELEQQGDRYFVSAVERPPAGPEVRRRHPVGLITGSHHMQLFWIPRGDGGNTQDLLPYAYVLEAKRWIPLKDTFLADPTLDWRFDAWNRQCIQCHATAGQPRSRATAAHETEQQAVMDSRVAEMGIACESCHGPGEAHVAAQRNRPDGAARGNDPTIVNPAHLAQRPQTDVCGQCHGMLAVLDRPVFLKDGPVYRPGQVLAQTRQPLIPGDPVADAYIAKFEREEPGYFRNHYWPDGMVRTTGREATGTMRSPCYLRGNMTCLSCHSMHEYAAPDDQLRLAATGNGNAACLRCHQGIRTRIQAHTQHKPDSPGSDCMNCHLPYTTFGLFKAVRSHEISSPSIAQARVQGGRPTACNLCHLDRSLGWAAEHLGRWYGQPAPNPALTADEKDQAVGAALALRGDAVQRVLVAWHMGWPPARAASGDDWQAAFLTLSLTDDYAVIRYVAERSLRRWPALRDVKYDFVAAPAEIEASVHPIIARWQATRSPLAPDKAARIFLQPSGALDVAAIEAQLDRRDNTPYELKE